MRKTLEDAGIEGNQLSKKYGFDINAPDKSSVCALSDAVNSLWALALTTTGNPAIGLSAPAQAAYGMGPLSQLTLCADTVNAALVAIARHSYLMAPTVSMKAPTGHDHVVIEFCLAGGMEEVLPQRYDYLAKVLLQHLRSLTGHSLHALEYHRPGPGPDDTLAWKDAFGCEPTFNTKQCLLVLRGAELDQPIATANPVMFKIIEGAIGHDYVRQEDKISAHVRKLLQVNLADREPRRKDIAADLGMSDRSLSRRLAGEGTSFLALVSDERRDLAEHYLKYADLGIEEIASALGFGNPSSFYRACKRWFGCTPGDLRLAS